MKTLSDKQRALAATIDHTILKPEATDAMILKLCAEARDFSFASVCINPSFVELAARELKNSTVKVCTVIGFPLGANTTTIKLAEAHEALFSGATELDMVLNIGWLVSGKMAQVQTEIQDLAALAHEHSAILKVIIETALLNEAQKISVCEIVTSASADFIKTSTGFSTKGATLDDILLLRKYSGENVKVKASGGIRDVEFALHLLAAGADRLGTSSGVSLVEGIF